MKEILALSNSYFPRSAVLSDHCIPDGELTKNPEASCWCVAFAPDSSLLAWSSGYNIVGILPWNKTEGRRLTIDEAGEQRRVVINAGANVYSLAFGTATPDAVARELGRYRYRKCQHLLLATGLKNGKIKVWDVYTGVMTFQLLDHTASVRDLKFAPDGSFRLLSASQDCTIKFWDLTDDGNMYQSIKLPKHSLALAVAWSPDAKRVASAALGRYAVVWSPHGGTFVAAVKLCGRHCNEIVDVKFSPDSALVVTASYDTRVIGWDSYTGQVVREYRHMNPPPSLIYASGANDCWVRSVAITTTGTHLASVADDGMIRFWHIDDEHSPHQTAPCHDGLSVVFASGSGTVAVGGRTGDVQVFTMSGAPDTVPSLKHVCRMVIRYRIGHPRHVHQLALPNTLQEYLKYMQ